MGLLGLHKPVIRGFDKDSLVFADLARKNKLPMTKAFIIRTGLGIVQYTHSQEHYGMITIPIRVCISNIKI